MVTGGQVHTGLGSGEDRACGTHALLALSPAVSLAQTTVGGDTVWPIDRKGLRFPALQVGFQGRVGEVNNSKASGVTSHHSHEEAF